MGDLTLFPTRHRGLVVVELAGDLDAESARTHRQELSGLCPRDGASLALSLARVRACHPAGLTLLASAQQTVTAAGGQLVLVALSFVAAKTLRVTGLAASFRICASLRAVREDTSTATDVGQPLVTRRYEDDTEPITT